MQNGQFNKDKFGLELKYFLNKKFDDLTIQGSELHNRLFRIFDESNDGKISRDEFKSGMLRLVVDKESRLSMMFKILDKYNNNSISKPEFDDFVSRSYKKACKIFAKLLASKGVKVENAEYENWVEHSTKEFVQVMNVHFFRWSSNKQYLTMNDFGPLCQEMSDLTIKLDNVTLNVPLCIYNWEFDFGVY
eukprot:Mrub_09271.p1 GENE.Mrub_09271~~Mrub_09271.p1  ORF type:complete len:217 (-),score=39.34 Mrub_09271:114-683(-)